MAQTGLRVITICALAASVLGASPVAIGGRADTVERQGAVSKNAVPARLPTDDAVRKGISSIRTLVHHHHSLVTHRRLPPDLAHSFAAQVRNHAEGIVASSTIAAAAADELAPILRKLIDGADAVAGRRSDISQMDGIFLMDDALANYGARFQDPEWTAER